MSDFDLTTQGAADITAAVRSGEVSAREVTASALGAIERHNEGVHAYLQVTPELAYAAADAVDAAVARGESLGVLAGVPIGFKDNMHQLGTRMTCSSRMLENYESVFDATCVANALKAGAIPLGKLNMDEFAFGSSTETSAFGATNNPWDLSRVPGGSSGGSAAAVASGMATVTLGSDTGGSIRQPAALCGVVGFKPTYGVVSRYGVVAFGSSLDQVGPFGKTVSDVAMTMNAIAGYDPRDCTSQHSEVDFTSNLGEGVEGMRVALVPSMIDAPGVDAEVRAATYEAARNFEKLGAIVTEVELPNAEHAMSAYYIVGPAEASSNLARFDSIRFGHRAENAATMNDQYDLSRAQGFGAETIRRIMLGSYLLSSGVYNEYFLPAQKVRTLITDDYHRAFKQVDVILTPTSPRTAFRHGEIQDPTSMYLSDMFTVSINIAGNSGISVPVGLGSDSALPVGVQLIGRHFDDANLLRAAAALESCYEIDRIAPMARG